MGYNKYESYGIIVLWIGIFMVWYPQLQTALNMFETGEAQAFIGKSVAWLAGVLIPPPIEVIGAILMLAGFIMVTIGYGEED